MKLSTLFRTKYSIGIFFRVALFLLLPAFSFSQTFVGVASNPLDNGTVNTATVAVTPPGGMLAGDLVIIFAHYRANGATLAISASGGQSWTREMTNSGSTQTSAIFWCRYNGSWPVNPSVSGGNGTEAMTVSMYVYRPTNAANSWGIHVAATTANLATNTVVAINGYSTTVPNTVSMAFWNSPNDNTWNWTGAAPAGWTRPGPANQVRNQGGTDQGLSATYNIRLTAGALANQSQTQSSTQTTQTSIVSWYELAPPANELCGGAINLNSGNTCVNTAGTLAGAYYTAIPTIGCGVIERNDVWYSFVAKSTNPTITLSSAPGNARLQLFSGTCGALASVSCGNTSIAATGLTIGDTYLVRVYTDPNTPGLATALTFNICVTDPVPANDLCGGAITLTSGATCVNTVGTLAGATYTAIPTLACGAGLMNDVWYSFVAQTTNPTITLTTALANPRLQLFSGTCAVLTSVACGNGSIAATGLTMGSTYFVRVYTNPNVTGSFNICITDPTPVNDLCSGAITLTSAATCVNTAGLLGGSTYTTIPTLGCGVGTRNDVWYTFTALSTNPTITLSSAPANPRLQLFSGNCAALTSVSCGNGSIAATGLTIGATYYIRVYTDPNVPGTFNICITDPAPANDLCGGAISLTSGATCVNTVGTLAGATYTTIPTLGCGVGTRNDVWYSFVAQSTNPTVGLTTALVNPRLQLFSGTCAALTSIACGNGSITAAGLTIGNTYFVRVYTDPNVVGTFNICITDPAPANDLCSGAITLTSAATCVNTLGTLTGATYTTIPTLGCGVGTRNDVWYTFIAQSTNPTITLSSAPANPRVQLFSGNCAALTSVACGNGTIAATGLTIGNTYYVRVYTDPNVTGTFNICITDPAPANDLCGGAILLASNTTCVNTTGTLAGSTYTTIPTLGCGVGTRNDVWYRFVAQTTNPTIALTTTLTNPRLQLFSGTCAALTSLACGNGSITASGLTIGTTYYVRVYADPNDYDYFDICVTDPVPANDLCSGAITLTSGATCVNTAGTLGGSSYTTIPTLGCGVGTRNDVWYTFTAQSTNPTITLSSAPANPRLQLFSGTCAALTSVACGNGSIAATGLTIGTTYLIRVYTDPNVNGTFNICITDPVPTNDLCASAILLSSSSSCVNTTGTLTGATYTTISPIGCGLASRNDVWYRFVAQATNPTITLSSAPAGVQSQLFSGTCGGTFTSVACGTTSITGAGLTVGNTYYIRVYADPNTTGTFDICVTDPAPANDLCGGAISLTSGTCVNTVGTLSGSTYTTIPTIGCGVASRNDVWYSFVANTTNPTITLSSAPANPRLQLFSGTCAALTSVACGNASIAATGLTIGNTYFIRVYADPNVNGTFNICITDPAPSNNLCGNAIVLTSSITCINTAGNMFGSTLTATTISTPNCGSAATFDIWYRFVAQTTNPTITLSSVGASFAGVAGLQLLSNNCGGTFTSYYCGTTSINANYLTPGTTYFIRVFGTGAAPTLSSGYGFNICVTDPVSTAPNDECAGAVNLSVSNGCSNNPGNMAGATPSVHVLGGLCTGPLVYDVWYKFAAIGTATTTITLSSLGTNFVNPGIEVFSGSCGALTSIACGNNPVTTPALTIGATYYIRVFSRTAPLPNGNARFNICLTSTAGPVVRFGNSYVNISKKTTGGVVEPGDTLEIRMTMSHTSGTTMTNLRYVDNLPTKTAMLTGATDRIRVITNEGLFYKQYTPAADADAATYLATPPAGEFNIRMNLGFGTSSPGTPPDNSATNITTTNGQMTNGNNPRGGGGLLFATAYRVVVTGAVGDTVTLHPARFIYRAGGGDITLTATSYSILISNPLSLCTNSIGINNATESGGTFGTGTPLNRTTDLQAPIAGYSFLNDVNAYNGLGDGRYAIVKNISPRSGTNRNANKVPVCGSLAWDDPLNCNNRMHGGHWYVDGDHTGTTTAAGNTPPDETTPGGYMLMVNADYVASEVFTQTINNLCPNTYYEFSAWFRNICPTCGVDSVGQQFTHTVMSAPAPPPNGYVGVYPNLSFALNGLDYYSTGEIDTLGWLKKGFVFRTGTSQTSATFSIRNNSQGGGGNDWVMDDIAVATCLPTMSYSPTINPNVCSNNSISIADTISSYFRNYTTYKWQRSVNGGSNWTDITAVTTLPDTNYYITTYTVPHTNTNLADSGDLYRVVVATTAANLTDPNCNISDGVTITLSVLDCGQVLGIDLLSFNGKLVNTKANLSWTTSQEDSPVMFIIERSADGRTFSPAGQVQGYNNGNSINRYSFIDPVSVTDKVWYRIAMVAPGGKKKYSSVIQLYNSLADFELGNMLNPFTSNLSFDITMSANSFITAELIDVSGKVVLASKQIVYAGTNSINLGGAQSLPSGIYTLRVINKDKFITKRVVKKN